MLHVQFGFDSWAPERLEAVAAAVHARGAARWSTPSTTCATPTTPTRRCTTPSCGVLLRHADEVVTLTPGAAAEVERRYGRRATVVPHPHVVELDDHGGLRRPPAARRTVPGRAAREEPAREHGPGRGAARAGRGRRGAARRGAPGQRPPRRARGRQRRHDPALAAELRDASSAAGAIDLRVHDYLDDAELWDYLRVARRLGPALPLRHPLRAGWRRAATSAPRWSRRPAASSPTRGRCTPTSSTSDQFDADVARGRGARRRTTRARSRRGHGAPSDDSSARR